MVIDFKIENFSKNIFKYLYYESQAITKPKDYVAPQPSPNHLVSYAVMCRQEMFRWIYKAESQRSYENWKESARDFYDHLCELFLDFTEYLNPNVFDKILIICAYIVEMGIRSYYRHNNIYLEFPHYFALYFDSFLKEEFYAQGSWYELTRQAYKYQTVCGYVTELISSNEMNSQKSFMTALVAKIKKDCHFKYLLELLNERASIYKKDTSLCYKCLSYCDLTPDFELILENEDLTAVELLLQICLNLMRTSELEEFSKMVADDLEHQHANCRVETMTAADESRPEFVQPCLKCYMPINTLYGEHVNQKSTAAETKPIFLKKSVSQEIFKRMFIYNLDQKRLQKSQSGLDFCPCCLQILPSIDQESSEAKIIKSPVMKQNFTSGDVNEFSGTSNADFDIANNSKGKTPEESLDVTFAKRHDDASGNPSAETLKNQMSQGNGESVIVKFNSDNNAADSENFHEKFLTLNVKTEHSNDTSI